MTFGRTQTERREQREAERERNLRSLCIPSPRLHHGVIENCSEMGQARPKTEPKRNRALLDMAEGRPCLLCPPCQCSCNPGSVVACHSNLSVHGKAGARKADDCYSVWGGDFAHEWLDRSSATAAKKEAAFMAAHRRQVAEWQRIAADPSEADRFRKAAQWALDQLATAKQQRGATNEET